MEAQVMMSVPQPAGIDSFTAFKGLEGADRKDPQKVGGLFEGIFFRMMLQQATDSSDEDPLFESTELQHVQQMFNDEIAQIMGAQGQLGIGDILEDEMKQKNNADSAATALSGLLK